MPTNLALDDNLITEAQRIGKHKTKREAVMAALNEYIQRRKQLRILDLVGSIEYEPEHAYKRLRHRKTK